MTPTAETPFTDGIGSRSVIRWTENLAVTCFRNPREAPAKRAIVIPHELLRPRSIGGGFPKLVCGPSGRGTSCDADMDHSARVQFATEEGKQRATEEISDWKKVAGPASFGMIVQEGGPVLSSWPCTCRRYFWIVRLQTRRPSLSHAPRIRSAPHRRLSRAISLSNATVSVAIFGLGAAALDWSFQKSRASLAVPARDPSLAGQCRALVCRFEQLVLTAPGAAAPFWHRGVVCPAA